MKTLKAWAFALLFTAGLGLASAQSQKNPRIPLPDNIRELIMANKPEEAKTAFDSFKQQKAKEKANPYHLLFLEMTFYNEIANFLMSGEAKTEASDKQQALYQEIMKRYPNYPDTYLMQISPSTPPQEVVDLATKALEATPTYKEVQIDAYRMRAEGYFRMGKAEESRADAAKAEELERQ